MEYAGRAESGYAGYAGFARPYGSIPGTYNDPAKPGYQTKRRRVNILAVAISFFLPVAVFAAVAASMSFSLRYSASTVSWLIVGVLLLACIAMCYQAYDTFKKRWNGDVNREPFWYIFLAITVLAAWAFGLYLGNLNYWNNTLPYEDLLQLSSHGSVDTSVMTGRQLMDVGQVTFANGTHLDLTKAIGFKNLHEYCVAPIVTGSAALESYDYWAIGLDCCSGLATDYHCGAFASKDKSGGLRLMREDQRSFYRLAVQQAEANYNIEARHPLFFYYVEDAGSELSAYLQESYKYFLLGLLSFGMCQLMLIILGIFVFMKL